MFPEFTLRYARLPDRFFLRFDPVPVEAPRLLAFNRPLAEELGFDLEAFDTAKAAEAFSGNAVPAGAEPLAQAYAGHQFGHFNPRLGDGRAVLLGEVTDRDGRLRDLQLKGAGCTPFSRGADGRAPLGPVLREYLVSEAMHVLGIPTTRALAAVATGERVFR
ncbi:MAG: protein adenylyltransferase SelO family protein, partial [Halomonas sp.]|nr:protein adenylyltransferase SelO family protein [Halomonas sp.]